MAMVHIFKPLYQVFRNNFFNKMQGTRFGIIGIVVALKCHSF